jgi:[ribosomal protein S18]-alanine N-acetyltransferase
MIRRDCPQVLAIGRQQFEFPWDEDELIRCLRQRNVIGKVVEDRQKRILGFMVYELHKTRLHIINFAVGNAFKRQGVGTAMIADLIGKLSTEGRNRLMVEVREANLDAQLFFQSRGFRAVSILKDFYDDSDEDAYLFQSRYGEFLPTKQQGPSCQTPATGFRIGSSECS